MFYKEKARTLLEAGYEPIPVEGKIPVDATGWTTYDVNSKFVAKHVKSNPKASIGLRCGHLIGIDLDIINEKGSIDMMAWVAHHVVDPSFTRVGQPPKRLIVCRCSDLLSKMSSLKYEEGQIEILANGQQFVAYGIHPGTKQQYSWPDQELPPFDNLPEVYEDDLVALLDHFEDYAKEKGWTLHKKRKKQRQETTWLPDDIQIPSVTLEDLTELIGLLPASVADDYDDWIDVGMALHFETRGSKNGFKLFEKFSKKSEKFSGLKEIESKWRSFGKYEGNQITGATIYMILQDEGIEAEAIDGIGAAAVPLPDLDDIPKLNITEAFTDPPPARDWLLDDLVPAGKVGALVGSGGTGKSNLAMLIARCVASGVRIEPFKAPAPSKVVIVNVEDDLVDIRRRTFSQGTEYIVSPEELARLEKNLVIYAGVGKIKPLMKKGRNQNPRPTEAAAWVEDMLEKEKPRLLVLDTRSRLFGLEENSNDDNAQWLALLEQMANKHNCGILIIHHVSKSDADKHVSGGGRGGSAFADNCRYVISLANLDAKTAKFFGVEKTRTKYFSMLGTKQNYSEQKKKTYFERLDEGVPRMVDMAAIRTEAVYSDLVKWFTDFPFVYSRRDIRRSQDTANFRKYMKGKYDIDVDELEITIKQLLAMDRLQEMKDPKQKQGAPKMLVGLMAIAAKDDGHKSKPADLW